MASGLCAECGMPRGGSRSRRYCNRCAASPGRGTDGTRALRARVLAGYGGNCPSCACCGETQLAFLTLDHVNGAGGAHRRARKGWQGVYREVVRGGFPNRFQLLCFNCNIARGLYGHCPHAGPSIPLVSRILTDPSNHSILGEKTCTRCGRMLPNSAFYPSKLGRGGLQSRCRSCTREVSSARLRAARVEALAHYAAGDISCQCCGEHEELFLALDHTNGEGPRQPGGRVGGNSFFAWLKKQGFPPGLRLLCHNCNCAMGRDQLCPHKLGVATEHNHLA